MTECTSVMKIPSPYFLGLFAPFSTWRRLYVMTLSCLAYNYALSTFSGMQISRCDGEEYRRTKGRFYPSILWTCVQNKVPKISVLRVKQHSELGSSVTLGHIIVYSLKPWYAKLECYGMWYTMCWRPLVVGVGCVCMHLNGVEETDVAGNKTPRNYEFANPIS